MEGVILFWNGDEAAAAAVARRLAPMSVFTAPLAAASEIELGPRLAAFAIWSAGAAEANLGDELIACARRSGDRLVILRADETPLPAGLSGQAARGVRLEAGDASLQTALRLARMRSSAGETDDYDFAPRSSGVSMIATGMCIGLSLYGGVFAAATATRQGEVVQVIAGWRNGGEQTAQAAAVTAEFDVSEAEFSRPTYHFERVQTVSVEVPHVQDDHLRVVYAAAAEARSDLVLRPVAQTVEASLTTIEAPESLVAAPELNIAQIDIAPSDASF